jgi:hypothetical protein
MTFSVNKDMNYDHHIKFSDNDVWKQINTPIDNENNFLWWHKQMINHVLIACSGFNGKRNRTKALEILYEFYKWDLKNTSRSAMPMIELQHYMIFVSNNTTKHGDKNKLKKYLSSMTDYFTIKVPYKDNKDN